MALYNDIAMSCFSIYHHLFLIVGELDANRSVPFRFTPSLQTFISTLGKTGMLTMCMLATARCLAQPYFSIQSILRAILRDEYIAWYKVRAQHCKYNTLKHHQLVI